MDYMVEHFESLRNVSESIRDYLEEGMYRASFNEEELIPQEVLHECYLFLIAELREFGIRLVVDADDTAKDFYISRKLIEVKRFISVDTLMKYCRDDDVLNQIENILSIDEEQNGILEQLYAAISLKYDDICISTVGEVIDLLYTTESFKKYLENFVKFMRDNDFTIITPDAVKTIEYLKKIQASRILIRTIVDKVISEYNTHTWNTNLINSLVNDYDGDKISATDIHIYAALDTDVPESLASAKFKALNVHHYRNNHHIEYWLSHRDERPTTEHILLLVAHYFEPNIATSDFIESIEELKKLGMEIFTDKQVEQIDEFCSIISKNTSIPTQTAKEI